MQAHMRGLSSWAIIALLCAGSGWAAENVTLDIPGGKVRGEVVKVTKTEVVLKMTNGKERPIPLAFLKPKEVFFCRKQVLDHKNAKDCLELGKYAWSKNLKMEGKELLDLAVALDASLKDEVAGITGEEAKPDVTPAVKPEEKEPEKDPKKTDEGGGEKMVTGGGEDDEFVEVRGPNGKVFKIPRRMLPNNDDVAERKPEDMKKFLDERLEELKRVIGGQWRMEETKHYYVFSNIPAAWHTEYAGYCEHLYNKLCEVMDHKEGDPLWHNKCPIYFFNTYRQFQKFAVNIDRAPGGANSGGYFSHQGRQCHVAIPFYTERGEKMAKRTAMDTLFHEGTHAFLQLTGKNVRINSWLHEGVAQFIEFWLDEVVYKNHNPDKHSRVTMMRQLIQQNDLLTFDDGRMRPAGGTDIVGYGFAWSRVEFLYLFGQAKRDNRVIPKIVRAIKDGKSEEDAIKAATGLSISELDIVWEKWIKDAAKKNFRR